MCWQWKLHAAMKLLTSCIWILFYIPFPKIMWMHCSNLYFCSSIFCTKAGTDAQTWR